MAVVTEKLYNHPQLQLPWWRERTLNAEEEDCPPKLQVRVSPVGGSKNPVSES